MIHFSLRYNIWIQRKHLLLAVFKHQKEFYKVFVRYNERMVQLLKNPYSLIFAFFRQGKNTLLWSELFKNKQKHLGRIFFVSWHCLVFDIQIQFRKLLNSLAAVKKEQNVKENVVLIWSNFYWKRKETSFAKPWRHSTEGRGFESRSIQWEMERC